MTGLAIVQGPTPKPNKLLFVVEDTLSLKGSDLVDWLDDHWDSHAMRRTWDVIACETFEPFQGVGKRLYFDKAMVETCILIGVVQEWARERSILFAPQSPTIKPVAQKVSKMLPGTTVRRHGIDAANHAIYYIHQRRELRDDAPDPC